MAFSSEEHTMKGKNLGDNVMGMNLGGYCGRNQCSLEEMKIAELGLLRHGKRRLLDNRKKINYATLHTGTCLYFCSIVASINSAI